MRLSSRFDRLPKPNAIELAREELDRRGVTLANLTDSNPTRHGLTDPAVLEAVARGARWSDRYVPDPKGPIAAREALAEHFGGHPDDYWLTASTSEAYSWVFSLMTNVGDRVATPAPGYPLIEPLADLADVGTASYPLYYVHPHGWEYDVGAVERIAARPETRAIVVVNPGNPTGAYIDRASRVSLVEICARHDVTLIADEVFWPFSLDRARVGSTVEATVRAASTAGAPQRLAGEDRCVAFAFDGLSKLLAAPQLKLGWIRLSGPARDLGGIAPMLDQVADTFLSVNGPVANALPELLDLANTQVERVANRTRDNLATARKIFAAGGFRVRADGGGWMVLVDVPRAMPDDELIIRLMREAHLSVHPGWFYDLSHEGTLALSLLPEPEQFREWCGLLHDFF